GSAAMRIAYWTTDEVNPAWALELADVLRVALDFRTPADGAPTVASDGVIYDLDYLPGELRNEVLTELLAGSPSPPAAVHSHNLDEEVVNRLRRNGVIVGRHIGPRLFQALLRAVHAPSRRAGLRHRKRRS